MSSLDKSLTNAFYEIELDAAASIREVLRGERPHGAVNEPPGGGLAPRREAGYR